MSVAPFEVQNGVTDDGMKVLSIRGELDLDTAPRLEKELDSIDSAETGGLMIDLSDCDFIDSTGVALIVRTWKRLDIVAAGGGKGRVALCCPGPQVQRVLEITGLESAIPVHSDRESALAELRAALKPASR